MNSRCVESTILRFEVIESNLSSLFVDNKIWNYNCQSEIWPTMDLRFTFKLRGFTDPEYNFHINFPGWDYSFVINSGADGHFQQQFDLMICRKKLPRLQYSARLR